MKPKKSETLYTCSGIGEFSSCKNCSMGKPHTHEPWENISDMGCPHARKHNMRLLIRCVPVNSVPVDSTKGKFLPNDRYEIEI